ncbi:MAG: dienelactone hydrolase family protein [Acidobacteriota bacterium]
MLVLMAFAFTAGFGAPPSAPPQPATGPGGSDYPHAAVLANGPYWVQGHSGDDRFKYFLFEPDQPAPAEAPVVLFLHGFRGLNPITYLEWMEHITKMGYTVVWVQYDDGFTLTFRYPDFAIDAWRDALARLDDPVEEHVRPQRDVDNEMLTAIVGHSLGGEMTPIVAARSALSRNNIPVPLAMVAIEPGGGALVPVRNLDDIDPQTKMVVLVGEDDRTACTKAAKRIWEKTSQISDANRDFLAARSDETGLPALIADHLFPTSMTDRRDSSIDARDFFITYKLSVGLLNCTFQGTDCEYALGDGDAAQVSMGDWSDGTPVTEMTWVADPSTFNAGCEIFPSSSWRSRR